MLVINAPVRKKKNRSKRAKAGNRMLVKDAVKITGGLSDPGKMPGYAYNLPAKECNVGSALRELLGSVCSKCYARKGRYVFPVVEDAMYRRLACLEDPLWIEAMAFLINRYMDTKNFDHFRWHDSGDLQSLEHLLMICEVCNRTPRVKHWLPTKELHLIQRFSAKYTTPTNLVIRPSAFYLDKLPTKAAGDLPFSTVYTSGNEPEGAHLCPANDQGHSCGDCRACWDENVKHVAYPANLM